MGRRRSTSSPPAADVTARITASRPIMGYQEIADALGVKYDTVRKWHTGNRLIHTPMPAPDVIVRRSPGWEPRTIFPWAIENELVDPRTLKSLERLGGRPAAKGEAAQLKARGLALYRRQMAQHAEVTKTEQGRQVVDLAARRHVAGKLGVTLRTVTRWVQQAEADAVEEDQQGRTTPAQAA